MTMPLKNARPMRPADRKVVGVDLTELNHAEFHALMRNVSIYYDSLQRSRPRQEGKELTQADEAKLLGWNRAMKDAYKDMRTLGTEYARRIHNQRPKAPGEIPQNTDDRVPTLNFETERSLEIRERLEAVWKNPGVRKTNEAVKLASEKLAENPTVMSAQMEYETAWRTQQDLREKLTAEVDALSGEESERAAILKESATTKLEELNAMLAVMDVEVVSTAWSLLTTLQHRWGIAQLADQCVRPSENGSVQSPLLELVMDAFVEAIADPRDRKMHTFAKVAELRTGVDVHKAAEETEDA